MKTRSSADSFGTFLENTVKRGESREVRTEGAVFDLLSILADTGPQVVPDLLAASGMVFSDFAGALNSMRDTGLISLEKMDGTERVEATPAGELVLKMKRSAAA